jgi:hypothetical protein
MFDYRKVSRCESKISELSPAATAPSGAQVWASPPSAPPLRWRGAGDARRPRYGCWGLSRASASWGPSISKTKLEKKRTVGSDGSGKGGQPKNGMKPFFQQFLQSTRNLGRSIHHFPTPHRTPSPRICETNGREATWNWWMLPLEIGDVSMPEIGWPRTVSEITIVLDSCTICPTIHSASGWFHIFCCSFQGYALQLEEFTACIRHHKQGRWRLWLVKFSLHCHPQRFVG